MVDFIKAGLEIGGKDLPRFKKLSELLSKRVKFLAAWNKWINPVAGEQPAPAPEFNVPAEAAALFDTYLKEGNLDGIIDLLDQYPRLKYMKDAQGMTILHRTVGQLLSPFIEELTESNKPEELARLWTTQTTKSSKVAAVRQLALAKPAAQITHVVDVPADQGVKSAPATQLALATPLPAPAAAPAKQLALANPRSAGLPNYVSRQYPKADGQQRQNASTILSYLLNTGIRTDVKDNDGKTAFQYCHEVANVGKTLADARYRRSFDEFVNRLCEQRGMQRATLTDEMMLGLERIAADNGIVKPSTPLGLQGNAMLLQIEERARAIEQRAQQAVIALLKQESGEVKLLEDGSKGASKRSEAVKPDAPSSGGYCTVQ